MIWLRILCDAIGRLIWFALGGFICGMIGGAAHGMVLFPLFAIARDLFTGTTGIRLVSAVEQFFPIGALVGCLVGGITGLLVMGIVGLVQGLSFRRLSLDEGFNRHFWAMFWAGFWCLLAGFLSALLFIGFIALAQSDASLRSRWLISSALGFWLLLCYFGGSLLGGLVPDALSNFWRRIKSVVPLKPDSLGEKANGAED